MFLVQAKRKILAFQPLIDFLLFRAQKLWPKKIKFGKSLYPNLNFRYPNLGLA